MTRRRQTLFPAVIVLVIILAANEFFNLGWWWNVAGVFNVADIGNALSWVGVGWILIARGTPHGFWNPVAKLIVFYQVFVLVQIALASLYYGQPLLTGIVGARHQFYFGSFFLFWLLLNEPAKIRATMAGLIVLGIFAVVLGVVEYLGFNILSHPQAEQEIVRSGIERGYIPGMPLVTIATIAASAIWIEGTKASGKAGMATVILMAAHLFRQSRMRLFGVTAIIAAHLLLRKKFKLLSVALVIGATGLLITNIFLPENIVISLLERSKTEYVEETGSLGGRFQQLKVDMEEFLRHPIMGSGTATLRVTNESSFTSQSQKEQLWMLSYKADLGYTHWMKAYGVIGLVWLALFFGILIKRAALTLALTGAADMDVASFATGYLAFVVFSFVTLNHMMLPHGIVLVCLASAIIMRLSEQRKVSDDIPPATEFIVSSIGQNTREPRLLRKKAK